VQGHIRVNAGIGHSFRRRGFDRAFEVVNLFDEICDIGNGRGSGRGAASSSA
jgi:hypothetical protein